MLTPATYEVTDNRPFTPSERAEIGEQVSQIKKYLRTFSPSAAQLPSIEARLDDLVSAAGRVGRKDWLMMFGGAILSVILADLVPTRLWGNFSPWRSTPWNASSVGVGHRSFLTSGSAPSGVLPTRRCEQPWPHTS